MTKKFFTNRSYDNLNENKSANNKINKNPTLQ